MDATIALIPIVSVISMFGMIVMVVWLISRAKQRQARYRADVQTKLIDKFNSAPELAEFLSSPAGRTFVSDFQAPVRISAHDRIFAGVKWSMITTFVGVALLIARFTTVDSGLDIPAGILIALGVGWLLATFISYRLSKSWGLLKNPSDSPDLPTQTS
jgi:hypothetical protein